MKLSRSCKHWSGGLPLGMSLALKYKTECTSTIGGCVVGSHNFSIGGRFFTSLALIPFSFIEFFASCISSGLRTSMPLFFGSGGGLGTDQSSWFLAILPINYSASFGVLSLKTQPAQLFR